MGSIKRAFYQSLFLILVLFFASSVYGQDFKKDSLVRIVTISNITPEPGFTLNEFETFYRDSVIRVYEESLPEVKFYVIKAVRGEKNGSLGVLWFAESFKVYYKYHNPDGSYTEKGRAARQKIQPILDKLDRMATYDEKYTDWVVQ